MLNYVSKLNRPTKYDIHPFKTIWVAELENGNEQYIQLSRDENIALWSNLGSFLEKYYKEKHLEEYLEDL